MYILPQEKRPSWLTYPRAYIRIVDQGIWHAEPWHLLEGEKALRRARGLAERYSSRTLFPFAYRQDNDELACWAEGTGDKVFLIHDFASAGYEDEGVFDTTWDWFRAAVDEMIEWDE